MVVASYWFLLLQKQFNMNWGGFRLVFSIFEAKSVDAREIYYVVLSH